MLSKTNGQVVGDVMTPAPVVVRETTNLEDVARYVVLLLFDFLYSFPLSTGLLFDIRILLETKYRRLPVVDDSGKLVGVRVFLFS